MCFCIPFLKSRNSSGKRCEEAKRWWLVFSGSTFCHLMEKLRPKTGNPLAISFVVSWFLLILYVPIVKKYSYHDIGTVLFCVQTEVGPLSVVWEHVVSAHVVAMA